LFLAGGFALGNAFGSFGDSDAWFSERYADAGTRALDIFGSALLTVAALTLLPFLNKLPRGSATDQRDSVADAGLLGVALLLGGAAALMTVPLAIVFGAFFGDEALTSPAVALAPQLGVVLICFSAAWVLAIALVAQTRRVQRVTAAPRWFGWFGYGCAAVLAVSAFSGLALIGLPVWVGVVSWRLHRAARAAEQMSVSPNGLVGSHETVPAESG
jgi:hypothetical protein